MMQNYPPPASSHRGELQQLRGARMPLGRDGAACSREKTATTGKPTTAHQAGNSNANVNAWGTRDPPSALSYSSHWPALRAHLLTSLSLLIVFPAPDSAGSFRAPASAGPSPGNRVYIPGANTSAREVESIRKGANLRTPRPAPPAHTWRAEQPK